MENRRNFIAALAGFFGFGATAHAITPKLEGFIVFFINVGSLAPHKADAFVQRIKDQWKNIPNWQAIWIPTRTQDTHPEFYPVNGKLDEKGKLEEIEGWFRDYEDKEAHAGAEVDIDDPELNLKTLDYAMLILGAPSYNVDQNLVEEAYSSVVACVKETGNAKNSIYLTEKFIREGTLAYSKLLINHYPFKDSIYDEIDAELANWHTQLERMI